jgi:surface antigen
MQLPPEVVIVAPAEGSPAKVAVVANVVAAVNHEVDGILIGCALEIDNRRTAAIAAERTVAGSDSFPLKAFDWLAGKKTGG